MPNPDPSLNERLAAALGILSTGTQYTAAMPCRATVIYTDPDEIGWRLLEEKRREGYAVTERLVYPDLLTYPGMGVVLEAMRERGWWYECGTRDPEGDLYCRFFTEDTERPIEGFGDTLPQAVASAAVEALEGEAG